MGGLLKALLDFLFNLLKANSDTPTKATDVDPNRDDADTFNKWLRSREESGLHRSGQERVPGRPEDEG